MIIDAPVCYNLERGKLDLHADWNSLDFVVVKILARSHPKLAYTWFEEMKINIHFRNSYTLVSSQ